MTMWEILLIALAHQKPPRNREWLAKQLDISPAAVAAWKLKGVPPRQHRPLATILGLTMDQLAGLEPLPWEDRTEWPFERISRDQYFGLTPRERDLVEDRLVELLREINEGRRAKPRSKLPGGFNAPGPRSIQPAPEKTSRKQKDENGDGQ